MRMLIIIYVDGLQGINQSQEKENRWLPGLTLTCLIARYYVMHIHTLYHWERVYGISFHSALVESCNACSYKVCYRCKYVMFKFLLSSGHLKNNDSQHFEVLSQWKQSSLGICLEQGVSWGRGHRMRCFWGKGTIADWMIHLCLHCWDFCPNTVSGSHSVLVQREHIHINC